MRSGERVVFFVCVCNEARPLPCPSTEKFVFPVLSKHISFSSVSITRVEDWTDVGTKVKRENISSLQDISAVFSYSFVTYTVVKKYLPFLISDFLP